MEQARMASLSVTLISRVGLLAIQMCAGVKIWFGRPNVNGVLKCCLLFCKRTFVACRERMPCYSHMVRSGRSGCYTNVRRWKLATMSLYIHVCVSSQVYRWISTTERPFGNIRNEGYAPYEGQDICSFI